MIEDLCVVTSVMLEIAAKGLRLEEISFMCGKKGERGGAGVVIRLESAGERD